MCIETSYSVNCFIRCINDYFVLILCNILELHDLQKAFDLVYLDILLEKLTIMLGLKGKSLNWFHSYVNGRRITTSIKLYICHQNYQLTHGVPQGSILGPILVLSYS